MFAITKGISNEIDTFTGTLFIVTTAGMTTGFGAFRALLADGICMEQFVDSEYINRNIFLQ